MLKLYIVYATYLSILSLDERRKWKEKNKTYSQSELQMITRPETPT